MRIDYEVLKHHTVNHREPAHITEQWQQVIYQCEQQRLGEVARARLALNCVDYITSSDLPFRLFVTRSPQAMDRLSHEQKIYKSPCIINGRHGGTVYSKSQSGIYKPIEHHYQNEYTVNRLRDGVLSTGLGDYVDVIAALRDGRYVTPLDGIIYWGMKRIAAEIAVAKKKHRNLSICMERITVMDSFTRTSRKMACYHLG